MGQDFLAHLLPWGYSLPEGGGYRLRAGGTMLGFEASGPQPESTTDAELVAQAERITKATNHFGTGDFLHYIVYRVAATEYPQRTFPSQAATLIGVDPVS